MKDSVQRFYHDCWTHVMHWVHKYSHSQVLGKTSGISRCLAMKSGHTTLIHSKIADMISAFVIGREPVLNTVKMTGQ